jgi:hypothetical protein
MLLMRKSFLAAIAALALAPASAAADQVTFGSDLSGTPDVMDNTHLADYLSFNTSAKNSHKSPVSGEILAVRVKGKIHPHQENYQREALSMFHTQVLRENGGGTWTVDSSSQHLYFPVGGSENDVHTFVPSVQCVKAGQYVDFNHIGGWDGLGTGGTRYQIWKSDPGSTMNWYEHDNGTNIGSTWAANRQVNGNTGQEVTSNPQHGRPYNRELMMQVVIGTGFDGSNLCEGGLKGFEYSGVEIVKQTFTVRDDGIAHARLTCASGRGFCEGVARMAVDGTEVGSGNFKINRNNTTNVDIPLSGEGARLVNSRGEVEADVTVESRDELGSPARNTGKTTLKSARPGGFPGATVKPQNASVSKKGVFFVRATCPAATLGTCTGTMSVASQKRVALSRGSRGKVYRFGNGRFTLQPGQTARVQVKLNSSGKKVFRKVKKVIAIATVTTRDGGGARVTKRHKVTLKRR